MTDPLPHVPNMPATRTPGWVKAALAVSVALNLGIAGMALGAWLGDGPGHGRGASDLSFGLFGDALDREDRRALRTAFETRMPGMMQDREAARAELAALLAALRAEPGDDAALTAALRAIEDRLSGRLAMGRTLLEEHILSMTQDRRAAFADRLERVLQRGRGN